jgi:hypothetical protein
MRLKAKIQENLFIEKYLKQVNDSFQKLQHKVELTKEQEREIQDYWQGLVGYKIPTDWHRYFYARTGLYSVKYIPTSLYRLELTGRLNQLPWCVPFSDKNMNDIVLPTMKQPHTYLKNRNGYFYVENKAVGLEVAVDQCANIGDVIIKPTLSSHGSGVKKLHIENGVVDTKGTKLKDVLLDYGKNFLIQDLVKQHPAMNVLNPDSINTIRVVTYRKGMEVFVLYAAIRIGRKGQAIDNESAGGISTKINLDGTLCKFAFGAPGQDKIELTDSGVKLEGYKVPSFEKALAMVKEEHLNLPFQDLVGWDICIDENGGPVMLEWNTTPELSQSAVGPAFGDFTEMVVKDAMSRPNSRMGDPTYRMLEPVYFKTIVRYYVRKSLKR